MAYVKSVVKAIIIRNTWKSYQESKEIALGAYGKDHNIKKLSVVDKIQKKFKFEFIERYYRKIKTTNSLENIVAKSFLGFLCGILLTYLFFFILYLGVNFSLKTVTYSCALLSIFLCLGLAYSSKIRCYVLLVLPVFFTKQGRQALLAYALFLAFTGPAQNTMHNIKILSNSMTCAQDIIKNTLTQIYEMVKAPFKSVKETLENLKKALIDVIDTVKSFVENIKRIILSIYNVIKKATIWLSSIINFCNKKIGTPFQRCMKTFDDAITDCKAKLGVMDFMCHVVHVVKGLCYTVKWLDFICMFTEFVSDKIIAVVKTKLKEFSLHMKNLFYVSIEFTHSYEFETTASNSTKQVAKTILQKISAKIEKVQNIFSFFGFVFSFMFLLVFMKVYYYRYKYLTSDRYDNLYISKYILDLDLQRAKMGKETVLPLESREKRKYGKPSSLRLFRDEKIRIAQSLFLLSLTSFKIISFLVCDYCLFWILLKIYEAEEDIFDESGKSSIFLHVQGQGVLADFYRKLGQTFQVPKNPSLLLDPMHCLPDPVTPDTDRYIQIVFLVSLCWLLTFTEPYGLRIRNIVMSYYYPDRAKERAVWLYNHILRSRGSFLRFARRQLRKNFKNGESVEKVTLKQRLFASFPLLGMIFGNNQEKACILCGAIESKKTILKKCKTPDCPGKYCLNCYSKLENICTICQHPIDYGDITDISEEIDSSDEEYYNYNNFVSSKKANREDNEKFMTFKELEHRDAFRDVEYNRDIDYAKISDLNQKVSEKIVKKKLKKALKNRIIKLKSIKKTSKPTRSDYKNIKFNLINLLRKIKKKSPKLINYREEMKPLKSNLKVSSTTGNEKKPSVTFNLVEEKQSSKRFTSYSEVKNALKAKLSDIKLKRQFSNDIIKKTGKDNDSDIEGKSDDKENQGSMTYYVLEYKNDFDFWHFYEPEKEMKGIITNVTTSLEHLTDPNIFS